MESRKEYVEKMKRQLDEWNQEIDGLEQRISTLTGPARETMNAQLAKSRKAYEQGRQKLRQLQEVGESSWESAVGEAEHVWKTLKASINYFRSQI